MNFNNADFYKSFGEFKQLPVSESAEIAFAGRSNVGKSSLINKILNRKSLARTSSTPGKTATINFYSVAGCFFADLPGYGYARKSMEEKKRWGRLVEGYLTSGRNIKLVILLVDIRHPPTADDVHMTEFLEGSGLNYIIVLTKADKLSPNQKKIRLSELETEIPDYDNKTVIPFSSQTGEGAEEIRKLIEQVMA